MPRLRNCGFEQPAARPPPSVAAGGTAGLKGISGGVSGRRRVTEGSWCRQGRRAVLRPCCGTCPRRRAAWRSQDDDVLTGQRSLSFRFAPVLPDEPGGSGYSLGSAQRCLRPTSCMACHRSIHSLTVIAGLLPDRSMCPARTFASWSRPPGELRGFCLVSKPDWLASPPGILYLTRPRSWPLGRRLFRIRPLSPCHLLVDRRFG